MTISRRTWRRFDNVVRIHPHHEEGYRQMLQALCAKWMGGDEEMFTFAREAVAQAPAGSPLGMLIPTAHLEHVMRHEGDSDGYLARPDVLAELHAAADRSVRHPAFARRPGWPLAPNMFAFVFAMADQHAAAADQFQMIGDIVTDWPWTLFDEPGQTFRDFRAAAYRRSGR
ncbi:hypothetical protein GCM10010160_44820 [Acrocarpospora corrugata]